MPNFTAYGVPRSYFVSKRLRIPGGGVDPLALQHIRQQLRTARLPTL
ncbi:MAG: hypothetical protein H8E40_12815 [Chloroflexi bacterium]|nr:hypothetical protein [Chloroflexota bacterium]